MMSKAIEIQYVLLINFHGDILIIVHRHANLQFVKILQFGTLSIIMFIVLL
jgi:hypothetical protein